MTNFKSLPGDKGGIETPAATFRPLTIVELPVEIHVPSALNVIAALKVAWASTAAVYTNSEDVVFRVRVSNSNTICSVKTHRVVLDPQQSVDSALASMSASGDYDGPLPPTHSPKIENVLTIHCTFDEHEKTPCEAPYDEKCAGVHVTLVKNTCISQIQANISRDVPLVRMMLAQFVYAIEMIARAYSDNNYLPHIHHLQRICPDGVSKLSRWNLNCPQREEIRVSELIEKQAQRHPDATAICAWDGNWTYEELVRRAYSLVQRILVRGVVPGQYVGLLLPKSKWTPVAMLAIVKSNCAFVLLNPARPKPYLTSICTQLKVQTLIYSVELESLAMDLGVANTILLAGEQNGAAQVGDPSLCREHPAEAGFGSAMYACFTSGSTGGPKGFAVDHASFCSGIKEYIKAVGLTPESRVFQFAPFDFAVSITDQLVPLTMGACVCIPSEGQLESNVEGAIHRLQANWLKLTPSLARTLEPSRVSTVRTLLFVGEESLASDFQRWQARGVDLYGLYGQSENSKGTMVARRAASSDPRNIGFPYHAIGWIVDPNDVNRLMPVGAPGELLLESASLAQGYIGREEETQSTFVGRPTWREQVLPCSPGSRFLRTGDLVRYEPEDGSFCLLGRQGNRVKIRGQRLELGQVENCLHECIPARGLIIAGIIHPRAAKEPMLVAFVAGAGSKGSVEQDEDLFPAPTDEFRHEAREALRKLHHSLPSFMVPNTLLPMSFIPRTATGKVHRRHLYEQASGLSQSELLSYVSSRPCYQPPQTGDEVKLQRACAQVLQLGVECVGMEDNFIELGGHSLTARQLVSVARADGLQLRLSQVLQQPTLAALAQDAGKRPVNMGPNSTEADPFRSLREHVRRQAIPGIDMSTVEDVLPTLYSQMTCARDQCVDFFVFRVDGPLDSVLLGEAWAALVNKLPILRTVFPTIQGEIVQLVLREIPSSINVVEPAGSDGVGLYAQKLCKAGLETHYPVDSPVVQLTLVQAPADPGASALILRLCHGQYDGMCLEKLMHSLFAAYHNRSIEVQSDFAQYTHTCRQLRTPEAMSFWRQLLTGASPTQLGPSAHCSEPDPILSSMRMFYTRDIPNLPTPRGITLATCVKAAWSWVLSQETGHNDVVFGQLGSCRESVPLPAANSVIGPCMNITPVRVQYRPGMTGSEVLAAVQAQHAQAMDFDAVGMDDILEGCTSWPAGTEPDTVIIHESFKVDWELADGDLVCRKTNAYFSTHPSDMSFLMTIPSKHGMKANLAASMALTREHAESIMDMFSQAFVRLVSSPDNIL